MIQPTSGPSVYRRLQERPPKERLAIAIVAVVVIFGALWVLGGLGKLGPTSPGVDNAVPWSDYATGIQARIDDLERAKDCPGLQREFDTADANNSATLSRTGHNNATLMAYIDGKMRAVGCH